MHISAVLLAGGKSSRMGRDKALLEIEGRPLWRRQFEILRVLSPNELFVAGGSRPAEDNAPSLPWASLAETISDELPGAGPLAGVSAALRRSSSPLVVVLALDLPMMTAAFLRSLLDLCSEEQGVVPQRGDQFEPLAAIYPKRSAPLAAAALRNGEFSMQSFVRAAGKQQLLFIREISDAEVPLFANLNTPADLAAL